MTGKPITRILAITLTLLIVALLSPDHSRHADAQANNATPIISTPDSITLSYMFPRGYFTRLNFPSAPATDPDTPERQISYRFTFTIPDASTTDNTNDTTEVDATAALLTVKRVGNTFEFVAIDNATPKQFNDVYGDVHEYTIPGKMYAYDNNSLSDPLEFTIEAHYDASPQWHLAADYWQYHIWRLKEEISIYEGPSANQQLAAIILGDYATNGDPQDGQPTRLEIPTDVLQIPWTASYAGARTWKAEDPTGTTESPYLRCLENHRSINLLRVWSTEGSEDSALVTVASPEQTKNGHATLKFKSTPDYEFPTDTGLDNTYQFRLVSRHGIHNLGTESATLGCDGSALDLKVKVKDVGPPAPIAGMQLTLEPNKRAAFKIDWDLTKLNQFLDDGTRVNFPDPSFEVSQITVSHDPPGLTFAEGETATEITFPYSRTDVPDLTGITGVPGTTYTITIKLTNQEGESEPVSKTIKIPGPPDQPEAPTVTTAGPTSLDVSWTAPDTNGLPIDGYSLQTRKDGELNWTYWNLEGNTATSATITTLEPDTTYEVDLKAHSGGLGSELSPPTIAKTEAFNPSIYHLFPNGSPTKLPFDGPIAGDPDGTGATYVFTFAKQGGTQRVGPLQMLLSVEGPDEDHDFTIKAVENTKIGEFRDIFDGANTVTLTGTLTATNTITYSTDLNFNLTITYDDSAQFGDPAVHQSENRWTVADTYETYEGSTSLPDISIPWTALTSGTRRWSAGTPAGVTLECRDQQGSDPAQWPADGEKDSDLFTVISATDATSRTVTAAFATAPDYEVPADDEGTDPSDNIYHLRITNDHDLHELGTQPTNIGCNGSAVDVKIQVKDVGPPTPVTSLNGTFKTGDSTVIELSWTKPTGFDENGDIITFPDASQDVTEYTYEYRASTTGMWTSATTTATSIEITSLDQPGYQVQVKATNSEGDSEWAHITVGAIANAPTVSAPSPSEVSYMFPFGKPATLQYSSPAGTDLDGDDLTYRFTVVLNNVIVPPEDAFLQFTPDGNNFTMQATSRLTTQEWIDTYATDDITTPVMAAAIYASDGTYESLPADFTIKLYYDPSAFFAAPATHQSDNRYVITEAFTTYEGPAAGSDIEIPWASVAAGTREWAAGNPTTQPICREDETDRILNWAAAGNEDSAKLSNPGQTTTKSGNLIPSFTTTPDFEIPTDDGADNKYQVRLHNKHNLHNPAVDSEFPSCSGSAVDFEITIKDVGTPTTIVPTGQFATDDTSQINLEWEAPAGFLEDGATVAFPHTDFNPSEYEYRYRPTSSDTWVEVKAITSTSATITGLTATSYQIQVRATNSEGTSDWLTNFITVTRDPDPVTSITAVTTPIQEGENAEFRVDLDKASTITVNLTYVWTGGYGNSPGDTLTFSSSDSETISIPTSVIDSTSDGSLTVTVTTGTGYRVGTTSSDTIIISREIDKPAQPTQPTVTALSTTSLTVSWTAPTSTPAITGYSLRYKKTGDTDWKTQSSTASTATITGLTVNTEYQVQVSATNSDGDSAFSTAETASTLDLTISIAADQTEVTEGQNITATVTLSRAVSTQVDLEYSWTGDFGTVSAETIQITTGTTKTVTIPTDTTSTTQAGSITVNIATSNAYRVIGTPATVRIQKLPKASITAITSTIQEASNAEIRVDLDRSTDVIVNLDLQWSDGHGTATSSTVQFNASASETASIATNANGKNGSLTITVTTGTRYTIGTPNSATVTITKKVVPEAPETPSAPTVTGLSSTSLTVSWTPPTSTPAITGYSLRYKKTGDPDWNTQSSPATTATITGLTVNTEYQVEVLATNSVGDSTFSSPGTGSTLDLIASVTASPTEITEGDYVTFTVTLSRSSPTLIDVDLNLTWVGDFGTQDSAIVRILTGTTSTVIIATTAGTSVQAGSITATIADSTAYRSNDNTVTVPINKTITSHPPVTHRFPRGTPAKLTFDNPIANDTDGTEATYTFTFARPDKQESLTPSQALLSTEGPDEDNNFTIKAADDTTPANFRELYGTDSNPITLTGTLIADNTEQLNTQAITFDLTLTYDDSPQFSEPAVYESNNRWSVQTPYEIYEGSTSIPALSIPWTTFSNGERAWSAGTPTATTFQCFDQGLIRPAQWTADGEKDSDLFTVTSATSATSGTVTAAFVTAPDYEVPADDEGTNPSDNIYKLRITNNHDLHQLGTESANIGCDGSAVDVKIQVKDVGTPSPITPTGQFATDDTSQINLEWEAPAGFVEDGTTVAFPHTDFNTSEYEYRYRPTSSDTWVEVKAITSPSATITGLTATNYQIQVRATNSEGTSPWPTDFITVTRDPDPQASITAVTTPIQEGENAEFRVDLDKASTITVNLTYGPAVTELPPAALSVFQHQTQKQSPFQLQ